MWIGLKLLRIRCSRVRRCLNFGLGYTLLGVKNVIICGNGLKELRVI
jgi:hypothetical protein